MLIRALGFTLLASLYFSPVNGDTECAMNLDFSKRFLASDDSVRLCDSYSNKVLLIVNTASYCGFTSQFEGLEALQEKYSGQGFSVLGFPSNDFFQVPRSVEKIREFCDLTYAVKFPMFEKTKVAKRHAEPLYEALGTEAGQFPKWNFHKYLLDREGRVVGSFGPTVAPNNGELVDKIEALL